MLTVALASVTVAALLLLLCTLNTVLHLHVSIGAYSYYETVTALCVTIWQLARANTAFAPPEDSLP